MAVSFTPEERMKGKGEVFYNYCMQAIPADESPGISVFCKDDAGNVFHTYSTYGRGVEVMMGAYSLLDLVPKGRDEDHLGRTMERVRHHDRYEPMPQAKAALAAGSRCQSQFVRA